MEIKMETVPMWYACKLQVHGARGEESKKAIKIRLIQSRVDSDGFYRLYKYYEITFTSAPLNSISFSSKMTEYFSNAFHFSKCVVTDVYFLPLSDGYN